MSGSGKTTKFLELYFKDLQVDCVWVLIFVSKWLDNHASLILIYYNLVVMSMIVHIYLCIHVTGMIV